MATPFVCVYFGPPDECQECGGFNDTGGRFCCHDCASDAAKRIAAMDARVEARRAEEAAFAAAVIRLREAGHSYDEIDRILATEQV